MAYDVFVVSAIQDRDMANLVVRRLRALKFKCWFDKKQIDNTFDQKDARCLLYTSPSPRDATLSRMPSSA